ncbi:uncharacterized protein HD556DRAFT_1403209 [Suillus plorans]|uniref:Secreted protein n=1 Tax=Suillus plorans TaxID=116603 RepID=A0A9P7AFQ8_9AGAM|nr:uncharacterized protein HD556DRAFT_1403209 [Suillus plorans]KAG1788406.1 hypothetical protein HD556DRAFT_1403209 [Suillus plorans]
MFDARMQTLVLLIHCAPVPHVSSASCLKPLVTNVLQQTSLRAPATTVKLALPGHTVTYPITRLYFLAPDCLFGASIEL